MNGSPISFDSDEIEEPAEGEESSEEVKGMKLPKSLLLSPDLLTLKEMPW